MATKDNRIINQNELLKEHEHHNILEAAEKDRQWWMSNHLRFATELERDEAIEKGDLIRITSQNKYFALSSDIRHEEKLQYLRPEAEALLMHIFQELDQRTNYITKGQKLILTSFHRCNNLQTDLAISPDWYRVAPVGTSSHAAGAAFDINIGSHYVTNPYSGELMGTWREGYEDQYDNLTMEMLGVILAELASKNMCNVIVENSIAEGDYFPSCFHVCVSPETVLCYGLSVRQKDSNVYVVHTTRLGTR